MENNPKQEAQLQALQQQLEQLVLEGRQKMEEYPEATFAVCMFLLIWSMWKRLGRRERRALANGGLLAQVLFMWSPFDPLIVNDLLRSIAIFGASGSGKTSGSGYQIAKAIVGQGRKIGGIIFASKPEDREFWQKIFAKAGRKKDLLIFGPASALRFNMLDFLQSMGADTREITNAIMIISETLRQNGNNGGRESEAFWRTQRERLVYNAVEIIGRAKGRITAPDLQKFITTAALSVADMATPRFVKSFHQECLRDAFKNAKTAMQKHDYELAFDFWCTEYPSMDVKPRSSIVADAMGVLHIFNVGMVRELVSTTTNVSPAVVNEGKWVLVNTPISSDGAAGAFILAGWKYLTQWFILKQKATEKTPVCVLWADEFQKILNSYDAAFLAECRSHRGCMVCLTQSIHSYYAQLGKNGEHEADSLLTNFFHKIFHCVGDEKTASYASALIGRRITTHIGGSSSPAENVADQLFGKSRFSSSFSEHLENIVEPREFLQGMRTGGRENGYIVDGFVIRNGEPFSSGENFLRVSFNQR